MPRAEVRSIKYRGPLGRERVELWISIEHGENVHALMLRAANDIVDGLNKNAAIAAEIEAKQAAKSKQRRAS
jgi:hypothetical protein